MLAVSKQSVFQPVAPRVAFWAPQADPAILGYALPCMVGFLHVSCARTCLHLLVTEMVVVNRQSNNGHVNAGIILDLFVASIHFTGTHWDGHTVKCAPQAAASVKL